MSLFTSCIMLNPNLSNSDIKELLEKEIEHNKSLMDTFTKCVDSLPTQEAKVQYINVCLPILVQMIF